MRRRALPACHRLFQAKLLPHGQYLIERIRSQFSEKITPGDLAREFGLLPSYMATCFKKETGMTVSAYLSQVRLENARTLLTVSNLSIGEICAQSGLPDQNYFARLFREKYGVTPTQYREQLYAQPRIAGQNNAGN